MTRRAWTSIFTATAMALALPVYAQDAKDQGQRPNSTGSSSGSATSRPAGGSGGSSGSSGGAVSRPSGGSGGSSVSRPSGVSQPSGRRAGFEGSRAPARPERRTGSFAAPRSSGDTQRATVPGGATSASAGDTSDRRRAVPAYSRPRDGRPTVGTAVNRTRPPYASGAYSGFVDPFRRFSHFSSRYPYGYYLPGYAFGVGYFYDPFMWGYASPYAYGGYYDPYGGYGGGYGGSSYSRQQYRDTGSLRLKVKPTHGQVYVDGYYVGEVDSFDGIFQRLTLDAGAHRIEIRADGYETAQFEVMVIAGETVTYKGDLTNVQ